MILVRLKFKLSEVWSPEYENQNSKIFKEKCQTIGKKIEEVYNRERSSWFNDIEARVTEIR